MKELHEAHWATLPDDPEPWEFARRRALLERALADLPPGAAWLDLGCGAGRFTVLAPCGVGVDLAEAALARARAARPQGDFRAMDGASIPLAHGSVALVWCSEVLEHVPDALGLLQECRRVLQPGGRLLVTTPGHPWPVRVLQAALRFDLHFDPLGQHVRFFTRASLARALTTAGLSVSRVCGHRRLLAEAERA